MLFFSFFSPFQNENWYFFGLTLLFILIIISCKFYVLHNQKRHDHLTQSPPTVTLCNPFFLKSTKTIKVFCELSLIKVSGSLCTGESDWVSLSHTRNFQRAPPNADEWWKLVSCCIFFCYRYWIFFTYIWATPYQRTVKKVNVKNWLFLMRCERL